MGDSESTGRPEFTADEREQIKDLVFEGHSLGVRDLESWLDAKNPSDKVRREVERLLRSAPTCEDGFLRESAADRYLGISRELPAQIGRYPVQAEIGSGGMGVVYLAQDKELNRRVAIKVLAPRTVDDLQLQKRLRWDAQAASALEHPNIVTVHEVGNDGRSDYVVMEYIAGKTLGQLIPKHGMQTLEVLGYAIQIASGLEAAHLAGIVHRDVKPGNIMITDSGVVKIVDFGLAKDLGATAHSADAPATVEGKFAGTATYVSPEQAEGKSVDVRSDIFSYGSVLFEMLTGRAAFQGNSTISVLSAILRDDPPNTSGINPKIDPRLDEIVQRCLRKERARRFQSIAEVRVRLEELKEQIQLAKLDKDKDKDTAQAKKPETVKRPWVWLLSGAILGGAAVVALVLFLSVPEPDLVYTRVTNDPGISESPALSPNGKLVAFTSDRGGTGKLDIFVQSLKDSDPQQLTLGEGNNSEPVFSADGAKLAFRSSRDGGGVYLIPAVGGSDRLVGPKGKDAQFAPNGQSLAYWTGTVGGGLAPGSAQIYTVPVRSGEAAKRFLPEFAAAAYPFWSPRGDRLLFLGRRSNDTPGDWWVASLDGSFARPVHWFDFASKFGLRRARGSYWMAPAAWLPSGKVLFLVRSGDATNIWSVNLTEDGVISGSARKLTSGSTVDGEPSAVETNGHLDLAYTTRVVNFDVWQAPLDSEGKVHGDLKRLVSFLDTVTSPSIAWDGSRLTFASGLPEGQAIRRMRLPDGKIETVTNQKNKFGVRPMLSGNGEMVAYSDSKNGFIRPFSGGQAAKICESCSPPTHINFDGSETLFESLDSDDQIWICSHGNPKRPLIPWAGKPVLKQSGARFSPGDRWVVFSGSQFESAEKHIWITPVRREGTVAESDLIKVTEGDSMDTEPYWSPDGHTIYFLSDRDGFQCIWGHRVDPVTAQLIGDTFPVYHAHNSRRAIASPSEYQADIGFSAARGSLVFMMAERSSSIWLRKEDGSR